jgi:hypothetical protein
VRKRKADQLFMAVVHGDWLSSEVLPKIRSVLAAIKRFDLPSPTQTAVNR